MSLFHFLITIFFALTGLVGFAAIIVVILSPRPRPRLQSEETYITPDNPNEFQRLPSSNDEPTRTLTIVVPAYNEQLRLPGMLKEAIEFLEQRKKKNNKFSYEIIIISDGSTDETVKIALETGRLYKNTDLRVISLKKNRGKGGAVSLAMQFTQGKLVLFVDADGASQFSDITLLENAISEIEQDGFGIAVGSRAHMVKSEAVVKRSFIRNVLMHGFHAFLYVFGIRFIKDTQCGFKLFTRKSVQYIFPFMHVEGWIFDIEILILAQKWKMPVKEVPITWHEVEGSKVNLIVDAVRMAKDILVIRLNYLLGRWTAIEPVNSSKSKSE